MSKPESAEVWWTIGKNTRRKLHTSQTCPAVKRAAKSEPTERSKHPNADMCQRCSGDGRTAGGGSREIYEAAKAIGEARGGQDES